MGPDAADLRGVAESVEAIRVLLERGADANVATKTLDIAKESALDRAARNRAAKILETTVPKGEKPTASQLQAADSVGP